MTHKPLFLALMLTVVVASGVSARTPTNAGRAFKTFDLYQRSAFGGTVDHTSFNPYPASLVGPSLLVMRPTPGSADTMGIFNSQAKDAIYFEVNGTQSQSFSTYTVSPPQYATSIGTLLMGVNIYNGSGNFADLGKQLATATVTFVDGDTAIARLNVGSFVRGYFDSGPYTCVSNQAIYATRPTDARSAFFTRPVAIISTRRSHFFRSSSESRRSQASALRARCSIISAVPSTPTSTPARDCRDSPSGRISTS